MSKCCMCLKELQTGDIAWELGMCNQCYNRHINRLHNDTNLPIDYKYLYENALKQITRLQANQNAKAVEALEKVKEFLLDNAFNDLSVSLCYIDRLIKDLKGEDNGL